MKKISVEGGDEREEEEENSQEEGVDSLKCLHE